MGSYITENYVKDKVIIVTGASSGFGRETAKKAAELGGKVVLAARREELLKEITDEIRAAGGEASYIRTDVREREQVNAMAQFAVDTYGRIDVLVNDAGTMPLSWFSQHEQAMEAWEACLATAINGTLYGIAAVYDQMIAQGQGQIINVSSILGNYAVNGSGVYNVSKAAVRMLNESLRVEARGKIKTTTIKPTSCSVTGLFDTIVDFNACTSGMYDKILSALPKEQMPGAHDMESIQCIEYDPGVLADNIIYTINQPWGVNISEICVRASNESMFV